MILSGTAIAEAVQFGAIQIEGFKSSHLNPASYDLTLGRTVGTYAKGRLDAKLANPFQSMEYGYDCGVLLIPGVLYLMHTAERIGTKRFVSVIDGKSSIGRLGICVHLTAGYGDPGFFGQYTLEVTCVREVVVYPGMRFCQVRFETMHLGLEESEPPQYDGNYQHHTATGPVPSASWKQFA